MTSVKESDWDNSGYKTRSNPIAIRTSYSLRPRTTKKSQTFTLEFGITKPKGNNQRTGRQDNYSKRKTLVRKVQETTTAEVETHAKERQQLADQRELEAFRQKEIKKDEKEKAFFAEIDTFTEEEKAEIVKFSNTHCNSFVDLDVLNSMLEKRGITDKEHNRLMRLRDNIRFYAAKTFVNTMITAREIATLPNDDVTFKYSTVIPNLL